MRLNAEQHGGRAPRIAEGLLPHQRVLYPLVARQHNFPALRITREVEDVTPGREPHIYNQLFNVNARGSVRCTGNNTMVMAEGSRPWIVAVVRAGTVYNKDRDQDDDDDDDDESKLIQWPMMIDDDDDDDRATLSSSSSRGVVSYC